MDDKVLENVRLVIRTWRIDAARKRKLAQSMTMKYSDEQEMITADGQSMIFQAALLEQLAEEIKHVLDGGEVP